MNYPKQIWNITIITIFSIVILSACKKDGDEYIPSYIHIDSIAFNNTSGQGLTSSHSITDAWIYINDNLIGAFELPATVPVLYENVQSIKIRPGIELNGIASTRSYYLIYKDIDKDFNLVKDSVLNINVSSSYSDKDNFVWVENFEVGLPEMEEITGSDTTIIKTSLPGQVFEGSFSGLISLTDKNDYCKVASINAFVLPKIGNFVFLELNYKTNNTFLVGLYANSSSSVVEKHILYINPKDSWNKIYINLTSTVSSQVNANDFRIMFMAVKDAGVDEAEILIDNIQLIYVEES